MPIEITIPRLGWNMDEGVFAGWLKPDGDTVRAGDPLFSLEGEKATQDVESIDAGVLYIPPDAPKAGQTVAVGTVIAYLLLPGETGTAGLAPRGQASRSSASDSRAPEEGLSPAVHHPTRELGGRTRPRSSPLARRLAREHSIDVTSLRGSGRNGRVRKIDVLAAASAQGQGRTDLLEAESPRSIPVSPARRAIAARMEESWRTTVPVTLTTAVDATNMVNLHRQFKAARLSGGDAPGVTDFVVKLTALALRNHPLLHALWQGDRLVIPSDANIGIAVETDFGLLVPVIHRAANLGLHEVAARSRTLIQRAREGRLRAGDLEGGSFTITNLGPFGVETFTPIINAPECAILGIGRIERKAVIEADLIVARDRMPLSLTFDHRRVDGGPAARFLQALGEMIENPGAWLVD
jgi:pyruvate dehydrogenase E2 component (dihydrolipoamide acetyltransferase)